MKWLSFPSNLPQENYELWNNDEKLLSLMYQPGKGTLRITTAQEKRVFIVRREGFLRNRRVLRNEYGVRIGQLSHDGNQDNVGSLEFYNEKFNYAIQTGTLPGLTIYKQAEPIFLSELPSSQLFNGVDQEILILVLCWYSLAPVARQMINQYA
jgi:hypothetical protein